jgi:hypothetical protein
LAIYFLVAIPHGVPVNPVWQREGGARHAARLLRSHRRLTGHGLLGVPDDSHEAARALYEAPFVVVSHGNEADPILDYGNAVALALWEMSWDELTRTPSRLTAEAPNREERARLLAQVTSRGYIDDYSGIRISRNGRRFRIDRATVWNVFDEAGVRCGQAATFARWEFL